MDVRVRDNQSQTIVEMSENMFKLLKDERIQSDNGLLGIRYVLLGTQANPLPIPDPLIEDKSLIQQYEDLFGKKPHHKLKEETIKTLISERMKSIVNL